MVSKRRNEVIAELFHRIHFVEKWGRGISLILSKEPTADFKEVADIFITTFKRKNYKPKKEKFPEDQEKKEPGYRLVDKLADGLVDGLVEGLAERLVDGLVENQKNILKLIQNDPHISKKKMAEVK